MGRFQHMRTLRTIIGIVLCFTPLLPIGAVIVGYEFLKAGSRQKEANAEAKASTTDGENATEVSEETTADNTESSTDSPA